MTIAIVKNTDADWGFRIVRGSKTAAKRMNAAAERAIDMDTRPEAELHMLAEMTRQEFYGATCDATRAAVCKILDRTFPGTIASFGAAKPNEEADEASFLQGTPSWLPQMTPQDATFGYQRSEGAHAYI